MDRAGGRLAQPVGGRSRRSWGSGNVIGAGHGWGGALRTAAACRLPYSSNRPDALEVDEGQVGAAATDRVGTAHHRLERVHDDLRPGGCGWSKERNS